MDDDYFDYSDDVAVDDDEGDDNLISEDEAIDSETDDEYNDKKNIKEGGDEVNTDEEDEGEEDALDDYAADATEDYIEEDGASSLTKRKSSNSALIKIKKSGGGSGNLKKSKVITYIKDPFQRQTRPVMTMFEYALVIGERAIEIEQGFTNIDPKVVEFCKEHGLDESLDMALIELEMLDVPFPMVIQRVGAREEWGVRELTLPSQILNQSYDEESTELLKQYTGDIPSPIDVLLRRKAVLKRTV